MKVRLNYEDGTSEVIDGVSSPGVIDHGEGDAHFFMDGNIFTAYQVTGLESHEVINEEATA